MGYTRLLFHYRLCFHHLRRTFLCYSTIMPAGPDSDELIPDTLAGVAAGLKHTCKDDWDATDWDSWDLWDNSKDRGAGNQRHVAYVELEKIWRW